MTSKSTQRNPLLIPVIVLFVIAVAAIVLLFVRSGDLNGQIAQLNDEITSLNN